MNTPTPKTDKAWSCFSGYTEPLQDVKDLSHELERELTAMTEQRDGLRAGIDYATDELTKVKEQRDQWANLWVDLSRASVKDTVKVEREVVRVTEQRDEWKAKFIQQNKDLGCEQMDPNGTIWDYAKKVQSEILTVTKERDEAREELAGIEDKMRVELGGHPNSKVWGDAGLIAATMRCVDALGEVTDQRDEARAEMIRWMSIAEGRGRTDDDDTGKAMAKLIRQRDEAREQRDRLAKALKMITTFDYTDLQCDNGHGPRSVATEALQSLNQPTETKTK